MNSLRESILEAEAGDVRVQVYLGLMYELGIVVPADPQESARWWRKAAEQGNVWACQTLATFYARGEGVPQNDEEAEKWRQRAVDLGDDRRDEP